MTPPTRKHLLLVDDDPAGAELTIAALATIEPDAAVTVLADGEEALDYVFRRGEFAGRPVDLPAAMLLDLKMPKVDGHEVLRQIRADDRVRHLKVVVLTSSDQDRDRRLSDELGSDGYLVKPASIAGLINELRQAAHLLFPSGPATAG